MNPEWTNPELAHQFLEQAIVASAWYFIAIAVLTGVLSATFIAGECLKLLQARRKRLWAAARE